MFGEKDEVEFWNTLLEMLIENPRDGGDVEQSNGRHTSGVNKNSLGVNQRWGKQCSGGKWKKNESNHPFPRFQSEIWYYVCWVSDLFICKSHCTSLKMPCPRNSKKIHQHLSLYSLCLYRLTSRILITMVYLRCPQWVPMYPFWHRQWSSLQLPPFMQRMLQCWTWKGKKKDWFIFAI